MSIKKEEMTKKFEYFYLKYIKNDKKKKEIQQRKLNNYMI